MEGEGGSSFGLDAHRTTAVRSGSSRLFLFYSTSSGTFLAPACFKRGVLAQCTNTPLKSKQCAP